MFKPNLKNMLLAIIGLMASSIFITKAIVPWMVNPVKEWERKATDRKNKINSLQKTQKTADLYRKRLAKLNSQGSDRVVCPRRHFRDGRSNHAQLSKTGRSQSATPSTVRVH